MKKILLLSENLLGDSGGAESYGAHMAQTLSEKYDVTIVSKKGYTDKDNVQNKYNLKSINIETVDCAEGCTKVGRVLSRLAMREQIKTLLKNGQYDLFINTNSNRMPGFTEIPCVHLIHFPKPNYNNYFPKLIGDRLNHKYINSYNLFLANSIFTKKWIHSYWGIDAKVLYPPIYTEPIANTSKDLGIRENIILMVGRINPIKKIKEAAEVFCSGIGKKYPDYSLHIIGNKDKSELDYYEEIKGLLNTNKIFMHTDIDYSELISWYRKAKIFWHFAGYMIDEDSDPENMEHFGMTTVEAMTQGCVPVVINKAGQKESVKDGYDGFRWSTVEELNIKTEQLISDNYLLNIMSLNAIEDSKRFLLDEFNKKCFRYIDPLLLNKSKSEANK